LRAPPALPLITPCWRAALAPTPTCSERSASVERTAARACASRAAAMRTLALPWLARSIRPSSTGSLNAFHHSPRGCASAGVARVHFSLNCAGGSGGSFSGSTVGSEVAQPARNRNINA
jgi:hypothetical protein